MHRAQNCVINGRTAVRSADVQTRMYFRCALRQPFPTDYECRSSKRTNLEEVVSAQAAMIRRKFTT